MFEDSMMESGGKLKTKTKYWAIAAIALNGSVLITLILWPLFHLESLPNQMLTTLLVAPAPPPPPPPPPPPAPPKPVIKAVAITNQLLAPTKIPKEIKKPVDEPPPPSSAGIAGMEGMTGGSAGGAIGGLLGGSGNAPPQVVKAAPPQKVKISGGVFAGNKVSGANPTYPAIARAARIQGTVILQATISKQGTIENLRVISGPPMLQSGALSAVQGWRYKPYLLNGEPVEVETTVNVVFNLGG